MVNPKPCALDWLPNCSLQGCVGAMPGPRALSQHIGVEEGGAKTQGTILTEGVVLGSHGLILAGASGRGQC